MESLQKIFNLVVGVHEPWYAQRGMPKPSARAPLPQRMELPACWRRGVARRVHSISPIVRR